MKINFVTAEESYQDEWVMLMCDALVEIDDEISATDVSAFGDEEADLNVYFDASNFDPETTTETAVFVTDEYVFDTNGEFLLDVADKIACSTPQLQQEIYEYTGKLVNIITAPEDFEYDEWAEFLKGEEYLD